MMTVSNLNRIRQLAQSGLIVLAWFMAATAILSVSACKHDGSGDEEAVAEEMVEQEYADSGNNIPEDEEAATPPAENTVAASEEAPAAEETPAAEEVSTMADSDPGNQVPADNNAFSADEAVKALLEPEEPAVAEVEKGPETPAEQQVAAVTDQPVPGGQDPANAVTQLPASPDVTQPALPDQPAATVISPPSLLRRISYDYQAKTGALIIDLLTNGTPRYSVLQETNRANQPELVVRLFNTSIRRPVRRSLDASEFRSPVSFIRTRANPGQASVDVVLTLRDPVQPNLNASDKGLRLSYKIPDHWYGVRPRGAGKAAAGEVAEPLAKANLYPKFDGPGRRPERIDEDPARKSIPPQGSVRSPMAPVVLLPAGGAWRVGQDNVALPGPNAAQNQVNSAPANSKPVNAAASGPANAVQNQADIAAIAASPGVDITGQDQAGVGAGRSARRINLDFRGAPLSEVIKAITDKSGVNFIYAGAVAAIPVTIQLQEIPWDLAFKSILDLNSLGLVKIAPTLFRVDLLANISREREQIEAARLASQRLEPTRIMFLRLSYAQVGEVMALVNEMLANDRTRDPRIQIRAETRSNSLIVEAPAKALSKVKALVERIDLQTPQVKIESRVVEVAKSFSNNFGISWGAPFFFDQSRGLGFGALPFPNFARSDFAIEAGGSGSGNGQLNFLFGSINNSFNLDLHLRMSESEGLTETLQTNSVLVQNNTAASIAGGNSDVFVLGSSAPGTAPQVLSVDYNMNVSVTPTVTADGAVRLNLSISSSSPAAAIAQGANGGRISRNINTVLLKRSGETAVIGGLNNRERTSGSTGIPILSKIPIIGALFRSNNKTLTNRELLLMVTPTIMNAAQSAGDSGNTNFDDESSAGTASSASPDKLDDAGQASEFQANELSEPASRSVNAGNNAVNANEAAGNGKVESGASNNAADAEALDSALDAVVNEGTRENGLRAANNATGSQGNAANNAVDSNADSADNAIGEGAE